MSSPRPKPPANLYHFAINADNVERARAFYEKVFGWKFSVWGPPGFLQIQTGTKDEPGIRGALQQRRALVEGQRMTGFECTVAVRDLDAATAALLAAGGTIVLPRTQIPTVGHLLFFRDTEGNVAGIIQPDPADDDA
jgi:hypothetical protein